MSTFTAITFCIRGSTACSKSTIVSEYHVSGCPPEQPSGCVLSYNGGRQVEEQYSATASRASRRFQVKIGF